MASHADGSGVTTSDAESREELPLTQRPEALQRPWAELERYAGWLAKDHVSVVVRADVQALGAAIDAGNDTSVLLLDTREEHRRGCPSGDLRKMLRKALGEIRAVLEPAGVRRARPDS